ncbi:MAG: AN1-type zinc finger domain-containing protein, partial [Nitrososphaerales archaeon]
MVSCEYCSKVEALPYQCVLCSKHFCSSHKDPQAHQCVEYTGSSEQGALSGIEQETKPSHEGL